MDRTRRAVLSFGACLIGLAPAWAGAAGKDPVVVTYSTRQFRIPVTFDPEGRDQLEKLLLFASDDRGESWEPADSLAPGGKAFRFRAPRDGEYWFKVQTVRKDGTTSPAELHDGPVSLRIRVTTGGPDSDGMRR